MAIAKFPNKGDEINAVLWEAVALTLAAKAGVAVPAWTVKAIAGKPVLLLRRFDRERGMRVPFLSAMSMLDAIDQETRSYLEFVDVLRQHGASPKEDMRALWRRIVFSIMISNTDDHLRNHGFLYAGPAGVAHALVRASLHSAGRPASLHDHIRNEVEVRSMAGSVVL